MIDLVCVAADRSMAAAIEGILERPMAVGIRSITFEVLVHPERDPGCFHEAKKLLGGYAERATHALIVLDREWEGAPEDAADEIEKQLEASLEKCHQSGWARAVVIDPELEAWVFSDSPHVAKTLAWTGSTNDLRHDLEKNGLWEVGRPKPRDPKRAMDWALHRARLPRSSSLFRRLAQSVSFQRCQDRSFLRLLQLLRDWYGLASDRAEQPKWDPHKFARACIELAAAALDQPPASLADHLAVPPDLDKGDYALPCFPLARLLRRAPDRIAAEAAARIAPAGLVQRVEAVGGYLNFFIDREAERRCVLEAVAAQGKRYGFSDEGGGRYVVIDYSSPNIAKPFHIGHMRSTNIGAALYRIHEATGYRPVGINHLGDWGTQFGNLMEAFARWGDEEQLARDPIGHLFELYVRFTREAKTDEALAAAGREKFRGLEAGDAELRALWQRFRDLSIEKFEQVYRLLGVRFDHYAGESVYEPVLGRTIEWAESAGIAEISDGALIVPLGEGLAPAILRKSDGATTYLTRDLAAVRERHEKYDPAKMLYVVGAPQRDHFRQLFGLLEKLGCEWAARCVHVSFGHVHGLSTREGQVIFLEDLLETATSKVREVIREKNPELAGADEVARQVGVGAVVFNDLRAARIKDVTFDWDEVLTFEGETGPYCMFTHARVCSILRKYGEPVPRDADFALLDTPEDLAVVKALARFPEQVARAGRELEPSVMSRALLDVAAVYSSYLHAHRILDPGGALTDARVALVDAVRQVLANGLWLLGLAAPEEM